MTAAALRRRLAGINKRVPIERVRPVVEIERHETADEALARFNAAHPGRRGYVLGVPAPLRTDEDRARFLIEFKAKQLALLAEGRGTRLCRD